MQVFIMRHGDASQFGSSDAERPLTEQGQLEASVMAKWLQGNHIEFDHILISPYKRAQQTAAQLLSILDCSPSTTTLDLITPSGSTQAVHDYIDGISAVERIERLLIVSHMPLVSYLVAELTVEQEAPIFQTAAIAEVEYDLKRMKGHLTRLVSPNDLC